MARSFDTAIGSAATPRRAARPGRIRRWLAGIFITMIALIIAHIIAADPIGRLCADLERGGYDPVASCDTTEVRH